MSALADELVRSAEVGKPSPDIGSVLRMAVDANEWKKLVRDRSVVQATLYLPKIVKKVAEKAVKDGDIQAARLLFEYMDVIPRRAGQGVTVATQINITPQELEEIKREVGEVVG